MNFAFTEEQLEMQEMVREFVEKEITPIAGEMDAENATRPELFKMAADMGLLNIIVPEELKSHVYCMHFKDDEIIKLAQSLGFNIVETIEERKKELIKH